MINIIIKNKKAKFNYEIFEKIEAGIQLRGSEIKSVRLGKCQINDSYISIKNNEAFLANAHIAKFEKSSIFNHDETRRRKLLLHKNEILRLDQKMRRDGFAVIPLSLYFKGSLLKVEIALAKGKKLYDKRETLKRKEELKKAKKAIKNNL